MAVNEIDRAIGAVESNNNPAAQNPASSAAGMFQFTQGTFDGVKKNNPDLPQVTFDEFKKDPEIQSSYQVALRQEHENNLNKSGIPVTPTNQYILHWAGGPSGVPLLRANDNDPLGQFIEKNKLDKNRLSPDMTVGEFKANVNSKMTRALKQQGIDPTALGAAEGYTVQGSGGSLDKMYKEQLAGQQTAQTYEQTLRQKIMGEKLNKYTEDIAGIQPGSPEFNKITADALYSGSKKEFGPQWTQAIVFAALGLKDKAATMITGGIEKEPIQQTVLVDGNPIQVLKHGNERGDLWYTDPVSGRRLSDMVAGKIIATSPETSVERMQTLEKIKTGVPVAGSPLSAPESAALQELSQNVKSRSSTLPTQLSNLNNISSRTNELGKYINTIANDKNNRAFVKLIDAVRNGAIDEGAVQNAMIALNIPTHSQGPFRQYINDLTIANQENDKNRKMSAPGAYSAGPVDLTAGTAGVRQWMIRQDRDLQMQKAYTDFLSQGMMENKSSEKINKEWESSRMYQALENQSKLRSEKMTLQPGGKHSLKNGDPVAVTSNGRVVIRTWNDKTGKAE